MKKIILLVPVLLLLAASCNKTTITPSKSQSDNANQEETPKSNQNPPNNNSPAVESWKTYKNDKWGFQLTLTDAWEGYRLQEGLSSDGITYNILFETQTVDPETKQIYPDFPIFSISVLPKLEWDKYPGDPNRPPLLAEKDGNVFFYYTYEMDSDPFIQKIRPKDKNGNYINFEVSKIKGSFKFFR